MAIEKFTQDDVDDARADLESAEAEAERLRAAFLSNETLDWDAVTDAEAKVRRAEANLIRVQRAKERYDADVVPALRQLRADVLKNAPADTREYVELATQVWTAAQALQAFTVEHNSLVSELSNRAKALGVPDRGVVSTAHEGLGLNSVSDLLVDDMTIQKVELANILGLLFVTSENGIVPRPDGPEVQWAFKLLGNAGKATV